MNDELYEPAQRTTLAWRRTGLSIFAVALLTMRGLPHAGVPGSPVAGGILLVLAALTYLLGHRLARQRERDMARHRPAATMDELAPVAIGTGLIGVAAFMLAVLWI